MKADNRRVRRKPYWSYCLTSEKAHNDVLVTFADLDDGRLTDGKGRTADFRNTIIIMTSNIGSHEILEYQQAAVTTNK